jgi:hypothetical protein
MIVCYIFYNGRERKVTDWTFGGILYNVYMKLKFVTRCLTFRSVVPCSGETETYIIFVRQIHWGLFRMKVVRASGKYFPEARPTFILNISLSQLWNKIPPNVQSVTFLSHDIGLSLSATWYNTPKG